MKNHKSGSRSKGHQKFPSAALVVSGALRFFSLVHVAKNVCSSARVFLNFNCGGIFLNATNNDIAHKYSQHKLFTVAVYD